MVELQELNGTVILQIRVQPRSSRNLVSAIEGNALKVCITAPPADGEANAACIKLLSETLRIPKTRITIVSGHKNRNKRIQFTGVEKQYILQQLKALFDL